MSAIETAPLTCQFCGAQAYHWQSFDAIEGNPKAKTRNYECQSWSGAERPTALCAQRMRDQLQQLASERDTLVETVNKLLHGQAREQTEGYNQGISDTVDQLLSWSKGNKTIIRDAGVLQEAVRRLVNRDTSEWKYRS